MVLFGWTFLQCTRYLAIDNYSQPTNRSANKLFGRNQFADSFKRIVASNFCYEILKASSFERSRHWFFLIFKHTSKIFVTLAGTLLITGEGISFSSAECTSRYFTHPRLDNTQLVLPRFWDVHYSRHSLETGPSVNFIFLTISYRIKKGPITTLFRPSVSFIDGQASQ